MVAMALAAAEAKYNHWITTKKVIGYRADDRPGISQGRSIGRCEFRRYR